MAYTIGGSGGGGRGISFARRRGGNSGRVLDRIKSISYSGSTNK